MPRPTQGSPQARTAYAYGAITPFGPAFQRCSASPSGPLRGPYYPGTAATAPVWATPLSLATTRGITVVFSSSAYLDVSVQRVCPALARGGRPSACRVAPFGHPRITGHLRLPAAFRSLSRPSSPPEAQASPVRPCSLPRRAARLPPDPHPVMYLLTFPYACRFCFLQLATTSKNVLSVENIGVEPMTPCLQSRCSSQLS